MVILASGMCSMLVGAEENRYKSWIEESVIYRFDNQTGEIHKLIKPAAGPGAWVKCDITEPKPAQQTVRLQQLPTIQQQPQQTPSNQYASASNIVPRAVAHTPASIIDAESMIMPSINADGPALRPAPTNVSANRQIELFDDLGNNITNKIDDSDRAGNRPTINAYDALHVSHTLKTSGDRISGIVILDNKGNRKISMLELTMTVRVIGKDKPIEHKRFIFADDGSGDKPPVPSFGSSGMSVLKKIDVPTPSGVINGMPEVRVTYLKFDDKE
jgi:hypothetical protein